MGGGRCLCFVAGFLLPLLGGFAVWVVGGGRVVVGPVDLVAGAISYTKGVLVTVAAQERLALCCAESRVDSAISDLRHASQRLAAAGFVAYAELLAQATAGLMAANARFRAAAADLDDFEIPEAMGS